MTALVNNIGATELIVLCHEFIQFLLVFLQLCHQLILCTIHQRTYNNDKIKKKIPRSPFAAVVGGAVVWALG